MPLCLQFAQHVGPPVTETIKRMTDCGYHIYTSRTSYYPCPEGSLAFGKLSKIPKLPSKKGSRNEMELLRRYQTELGQSVRQVTVRDFTTKDKPGTLPVSAYNPQAAQTNPLNIEVITPTITQRILLTYSVIEVLHPRDVNFVLFVVSCWFDAPL